MRSHHPLFRTLCSTFAIAGFALALLSVAAPLGAQDGASPEAVDRAAIQQRLGWPAAVDLDARYAAIEKTPEGLADYRARALETQRHALGLKLDQYHATLTFDGPLPIEETIAMIETYELRPRLMVSFIDDQGQVSTVLSAIGDRYWAKGLATAELIAAEEPGWVGVTALVASVKADRVEVLQQDPRVYLLDLSADRHVARNPDHREYAQSLAWPLYHLNRYGQVPGDQRPGDQGPGRFDP